MRQLRVINERTGQMLGDRVALADQWWSRLRGLLGRPELRSGEGLLLTPCRAVHMHGMAYELDVVMLNSVSQVVAIYERMAPGSRTRWHRDAVHTLELPGGTVRASDTQLGDALVMLPVPQDPARESASAPADAPAADAPAAAADGPRREEAA